MTAEAKKELTVGRYEFFKEKGRSDSGIAKDFGMDMNKLNKWKKENNLIGKDYGLRGKKPGTIKTISIKGEEVEPMKENDISKERLTKTPEEYEANKQVKVKLEKRKPAAPELNLEEIVGAVYTEVQDHSKEPHLMPISEPSYVAFSSEETDSLKAELAKMREENEALERSLKEIEQKAGYQELLLKVSEAVKAERYRQNSLYGHQRHSYGDWLMILGEEVGEVAQAMQKAKGWGKETDADNLFEELIHVSAVASAIAEQVLEERSK